MKEFLVGTSPITGVIYAGFVKNGLWQGTKHEVTKSAVLSVAEHLIIKNESVKFKLNGKKYILQVQELETK